MLESVSLVFSHVVYWAAMALVLSWGQLPVQLRRSLALGVSGLGVVFLVVGLNIEGQRDAPTTGAFLLGASYVTGHASAAANLPYYVMTGVCLLVGTAGLALPEGLAARLADRWLGTAVVLSILVTLVRLALEQAAAPASWVRIAGITGLGPIVGAYFFLVVRDQGGSLRSFFLALLAYAFLLRGWIALLYVVATTWQLGSHFDLSAVVQVTGPFGGSVQQFESGSWRQMLNLAIVPQLTFWPLFTVATGVVGAGLASGVRWVMRLTGRPSSHDVVLGPPARPGTPARILDSLGGREGGPAIGAARDDSPSHGT